MLAISYIIKSLFQLGFPIRCFFYNKAKSGKRFLQNIMIRLLQKHFCFY